MAFADPDTIAAYTAAYDAWREQLEHVHRVFLQDERLRPDQLKGLLNREARAKERYDSARLRLLGLDDAPATAPGPGNDDNPFR